MTKKKFLYSLPVMVALAFNGCGTSSTTQIEDTVAPVATESDKLLSSGYSVVVERGAVYDSNVTDANGSEAIQVSDTNNTYIFENEPVYPITAEGGWIDVDSDGNLTDTDVALDINLTSYSDVVTPTTTYIADENETIREERLEGLMSETNCTAEDLLSAPSEATRNSIIVLNAVYEKLIEKGNTHSKAPIAISAILERYVEIDNNANLDENATSEEMSLALEEQTMFNLKAKGLIKKLDNDDIEEFKAKKPKKLKDEDEDSVEDEIEIEEEDEYLNETDEDSTEEKVTGSDDNKGNRPDKVSEEKENETDEDSTEEKVTGSDDNKGNRPDKGLKDLDEIDEIDEIDDDSTEEEVAVTDEVTDSDI